MLEALKALATQDVESRLIELSEYGLPGNIAATVGEAAMPLVRGVLFHDRNHASDVFGGVFETGEAGAESIVDAIDNCPKVCYGIFEANGEKSVSCRPQGLVERKIVEQRFTSCQMIPSRQVGDDCIVRMTEKYNARYTQLEASEDLRGDVAMMCDDSWSLLG